MITYKEASKFTVDVYLGNKYVGSIQKERYGWRYSPKGKPFGGECFPTLEEVKKSLEVDEEK